METHVRLIGPTTFGRKDTRKWEEKRREEEEKKRSEERERKRSEKLRERRKKMVEKRKKEHFEQQPWMDRTKEVPVVHIDWKDLSDPLGTIRKLHLQYGACGLCKVVPPVQSSVSAAHVLLARHQKLHAKVQRIPPFLRKKEEEREPQDHVSGEDSKPDGEGCDVPSFRRRTKAYDLMEFERLAHTVASRRMGVGACAPDKFVESEYWSIMEGDNPINVEYAGDIPGTGFSEDRDDPLASSAWNLSTLPRLNDSLLKWLEEDIQGITKPMLYVGMLFSTFAWHVEDHNMYSINFHHMGAPKTWYGVPSAHADAFEEVVKEKVYREASDRLQASGELMLKTTMFSPKHLLDRGVHVYRTVQQPGEFVITFPRAYHGGFSNGFNIGEAVNFATPDWLAYGLDACLQYSMLRRPPILPHDEILFHAAESLRHITKQTKKQNKMQNKTELAEKCPSFENALKVFFVHELRRIAKFTARLLAKGAPCKRMSCPSRTLLCSQCKALCYYVIVLCNCQTEPICVVDAANADCSCNSEMLIYVHGNLSIAINIACKFEAETMVVRDECMKKLYLEGSKSHNDSKKFLDAERDLEECKWQPTVCALNLVDQTANKILHAEREAQRAAFEQLLCSNVVPSKKQKSEKCSVHVPKFASHCGMCGLKCTGSYGSSEFCSKECASSYYSASLDTTIKAV